MTLIAAALVLIGLLYALFRKRQAPEPAPVINKGQGTNNQNNQGTGIVVRRKTATILKKQSLENVIGNPAYLQVDATDFTYESAVRRIYIKNTCIVDIYNMYAEDLQKPENPKEDGCMVLGRWVYDSESQEYYVSLEQIVLPGDDAVFAEYELNFGGKIKLKVVELLRKLRRETNFQYDLTCWVHSHPGLGVFFSNSDVTVQMQLKHPSHPNFLTAIVVDILTPDMDLGQMVQVISRSKRNLFPVVDVHNKLLGIVVMDDIRNIMFRQELYHRFRVERFMISPPARVIVSDSMEMVMKKFDETKAWNLPVVDEDGAYVGFVSKSEVFGAYRQVLVDFSEE
jgi:CBS domain-containing protein